MRSRLIKKRKARGIIFIYFPNNKFDPRQEKEKGGYVLLILVNDFQNAPTKSP